jgi:hypothetical protein
MPTSIATSSPVNGSAPFGAGREELAAVLAAADDEEFGDGALPPETPDCTAACSAPPLGA